MSDTSLHDDLDLDDVLDDVLDEEREDETDLDEDEREEEPAEAKPTRKLSRAAKQLRGRAGRTIQYRDMQRGKITLPLLAPDPDDDGTPHWRPKTRAECETLPRPCPYVGCRHHLGIDVQPGGSIILNAEDPTDMTESCALDVADRGGHCLDDVGVMLGVTRERVRQIEGKALVQLSRRREMRRAAEDVFDPDRTG